MVAIACERQAGVDIEVVRAMENFVELTRILFLAEQAELFALPLEEQLCGFFRCWTRKEAYIKGSGTASREPLVSARDWMLYEIPAPPGYLAAAALEAREAVEVRSFEWAWS